MFGKFIRVRRKELKLSLRTVAKRMGVSFAYLSRIEREDPTAGTFTEERCHALARILDLDPDKLTLAAGRVPSDVHARLCRHPELLEEIRARNG